MEERPQCLFLAAENSAYVYCLQQDQGCCHAQGTTNHKVRLDSLLLEDGADVAVEPGEDALVQEKVRCADLTVSLCKMSSTFHAVACLAELLSRFLGILQRF